MYRGKRKEERRKKEREKERRKKERRKRKRRKGEGKYITSVGSSEAYILCCRSL